MILKPICFNYREYVELREAYRKLLKDNQQLMEDNRKLRDKVANLEIRCRIAEADRDRRPKCY